MGELIKQVFSSFGETITGMTSGIKSAFMNLLYVDPLATAPVVSDMAKFMFLMLGLSLALGLVSGAIALIKNRA
ncbi:MAG: hypothetical protein RSB59_06480 [Clostridia bacterium]